MAILLGLRVVRVAQAASQSARRHAHLVVAVRRNPQLVLDPLTILTTVARRGAGQRQFQGQLLVETATILLSMHLSATRPEAGAVTIIPMAEAAEVAGVIGVAVAVATTIRIIILARPAVAAHLG